MDIWKHCLLSQRKFGGDPSEYYAIHRFIDSSKLFYFHAKHRLLLHNLLGIELACELFQDRLVNSQGKVILVRDIAAEHCKEDLNGQVPTLYDWLHAIDETLAPSIQVPDLSDRPELMSFVMRPYLRTRLHSSLLVTCSDFGIYLVELFLGFEASKTLADRLPASQRIQELLRQFRFTERWQYTPMVDELKWLKEHEALVAPDRKLIPNQDLTRSSRNGQKESRYQESSIPKSRIEKVTSKKSSTQKAAAKKATPERTVAKKAAKVGSGKSVAAKKSQSPQMQKLETKLRGWLAGKKKVVLSWDCGGDETLIYGKVDKADWEWGDKEFQTLCEILIEQLQLPNAGEEFNKGGGTIKLKGDQVVLSYEATYFGASWDEEEEDIIEADEEELEGDLVLF